MPTAIGPAGVILRATGVATSTPGPEWWDVVSGLLLAVAGMWATWAQFIYPKLAERKAKAAAASTPPATAAPAPPPTDLVGDFFRDQSQRLDDLLELLDTAHRQRTRDAGTIARLTAERDEARRRTCQHLHPERIDT